MTKEITYGRKIKVTGYNPTFAAKALVKMFTTMGADELQVKKAKSTNSVYITGELGNRSIEVRISDHSTAMATNTIGNIVTDAIRINEYWIEADITSAEIYAEFKSKIMAL